MESNSNNSFSFSRVRGPQSRGRYMNRGLKAFRTRERGGRYSSSSKRGGLPLNRFQPRGRGSKRGGHENNDDNVEYNRELSQSSSKKWRSNRDQFGGSSSSCWVAITGIDPVQTDINQLIEFLKQKTGQEVNVLQNTIEDSKLLLFIETPAQTVALKRISGTSFGNEKIFVQYSNPPRDMNGKSTRDLILEALRPILSSRFNKDKKILFLDGLGGQTQSGITFNFNALPFMKVMFISISENCPTVTSISFVNDKIQSLEAFSQLSKFLNLVENLNFASNDIQDINELIHLKSLNLKEIILENNPLLLKTSEEKYRSEISAKLPSLKLLDGKKLQTLIYFGIPSDVKLSSTLPQLQGSLFENPSVRNLTENFLQSYIQFFDENRSSLSDLYTDVSIFSMSCSLSKKFQTANSLRSGFQQFQFYKSHSRNLRWVTDIERKVSLMKIGRKNIIDSIRQFPQTKHCLDDILVDAFVLKSVASTEVLCIHVHSHFLEVNSNVKRSIDHSFLLLSNSSTTSLPAVILNHQMHIRNYTPLPRIQQSPKEINMEQIFHDFVLATKLKPEFAKRCLDSVGWDSEKAMQAFREAEIQNQVLPNMLEKS